MSELEKLLAENQCLCKCPMLFYSERKGLQCVTCMKPTGSDPKREEKLARVCRLLLGFVEDIIAESRDTTANEAALAKKVKGRAEEIAKGNN